MARELRISVFKRKFPDGSAKYEWRWGERTISAGLDNLDELINDVHQTLAKKSEIFISAPRPRKDSNHSILERISTKEMDVLAQSFEVDESDISGKIAKEDLLALDD